MEKPAALSFSEKVFIIYFIFTGCYVPTITATSASSSFLFICATSLISTNINTQSCVI